MIMKALSILFLLSPAVAMAADVPAPELPKPAPGAVASPVKPSRGTASRFVDTKIDDHILSLKRRLAINKQEQGPFGLYQIPGKTPIIATTHRKVVQKTPFGDYINRIQISVINGQEKEFLVGARMFRIGQVFPIVSGGERISVRVESVDPSQVIFKNLQSGESAARKLDVLPAGVTANAKVFQVPGVTPTRRGEEAPLNLDFDSPPPTP